MNSGLDVINIDKNTFWQLIEHEVKRYTKGRSSSVPTEIAKDIVKSVSFSINQCVEKKYNGDWNNVPDNLSFSYLLAHGRSIVKNKVKFGKRLYRIAQNTMIDITNISYIDTLNEINNFFNLYDIQYAAHDVPCMIDYQLIFGNAENELEGIDYIIMYLERFVWENRFCSFFDKREMISLYQKYAHDYIEQLINLCDPVYANAMASFILDEKSLSIALDCDGQEMIRDLFISMSEGDINRLMVNRNNALCRRMGFGNKAISYFEKVALELASRVNKLKFLDGIENIFISIL